MFGSRHLYYIRKALFGAHTENESALIYAGKYIDSDLKRLAVSHVFAAVFYSIVPLLHNGIVSLRSCSSRTVHEY